MSGTTSRLHSSIIQNELAQEVKESGFKLRGIYAVEGPAGLLSRHELDERLGDEESKIHILPFIAAVEAEPSLLGVSSHMLAVATATSI